jgi:hypothetical protein
MCWRIWWGAAFYYIVFEMFLVSICKVLFVKHRSFLPDSIMMNAAISACEKAEEWQWALHLLDTCSHAAKFCAIGHARSFWRVCEQWHCWASMFKVGQNMSKPRIPSQCLLCFHVWCPSRQQPVHVKRLRSGNLPWSFLRKPNKPKARG